MQEIETIPGFENTVHDAVSFARVEHLYTISEGERARADFAAAEGLLRYVQGLENAKTRKAGAGSAARREQFRRHERERSRGFDSRESAGAGGSGFAGSDSAEHERRGAGGDVDYGAARASTTRPCRR
jgi:hypothetical protein